MFNNHQKTVPVKDQKGGSGDVRDCGAGRIAKTLPGLRVHYCVEFSLVTLFLSQPHCLALPCLPMADDFIERQ